MESLSVKINPRRGILPVPSQSAEECGRRLEKCERSDNGNFDCMFARLREKWGCGETGENTILRTNPRSGC
jgi:hypothetical protein